MQRNKRLDPWSPECWTVPDQQLDSTLPKVTIGILSYNRIKDLRRTLDCITHAVQYPDLEVIVVDNASEDGSVDMVIEEFSYVRVIPLDKNIGTSGRNLFYKEARGKYVFSYDDDSFPATPATIFEVVSFLEKRPDIDAFTLLYYQPLSGFVETGELRKFRFGGTTEKGYEGLFFAEGGMCIRTASFLKTDGYESELLVYGEGLELTLQMYKLGMKLIYYPGLATLHMKSVINRHNLSMVRMQTRNHICALSKHFPIYALFPMIMIFVLRQLISMILHPHRTLSYIRGISEGILGIKNQRSKCEKLSLRQVLRLKRWYLLLLRW